MRNIIVLIVLSLVYLFIPVLVQAQTQPNIIVILTDDQGIDAIEGPAWPNDLNVHTPNLAALSSQGRIFTTARMNPVCSPTRAAILTGRQAAQTGVTYVLREIEALPDRDLVSLQTNERTIAEMLHDMGYYTIHIDKWQVGFSDSKGLKPLQQGYDVAHMRDDYLPLDDPELVGDEHISTMVNLAIGAVNARPEGVVPGEKAPYALFMWTYDPHRRNDKDASGKAWWKVDQSLLPSGEDYYGIIDNNTNRYRAVVEAVDTELGRMLRGIGVTDSNNMYVEASNTIVFFTSDNGTDREVAVGQAKAKGTLFEGGLRVPMFVFGEGVPNDGVQDARLINHTDFYDTIADIVGASDIERGDAPRDSYTFADRLGWGAPAPNPREYTISSRAIEDPADHWVALADAQYKLIARAGGTGLASIAEDEFYDLVLDPLETDNLVLSGMTFDQGAAYLNMRNDLVNYWPMSVSHAWVIDNLQMEVTHENELYRLVMKVNVNGESNPDDDEFYDLVNDPQAQNDLLESHMNRSQHDAYDEMRASVTNDLLSLQGNNSVLPMVIDIPVSETLLLDSNGASSSGALYMGHDNLGEWNEIEARAFMKFDIGMLDSLLPPDKTVNDIVAAQVIIAWQKDSTASDETDTGPFTIHPMTLNWSGGSRNWDRLSTGHNENVVLGQVDIAPHVIVDPVGNFLKGLPMPSGTPVSFGYSQDLANYVVNWYNNPSTNYGIVVKAKALEGLTGDQRVKFLRNAGLRVTLAY